MQGFATASWYQYLEPAHQQLVDLSTQLLAREQEENKQWLDYSFLVFPLAKAYEGFLKKFLLDQGLISHEVYFSRSFRIGRALNPDVSLKQRDQFWLYDDMVQICGLGTARTIWQTWLECRNRIFHFFPTHPQTMTLAEAQNKVNQLIETMELCAACLIANKPLTNYHQLTNGANP